MNIWKLRNDVKSPGVNRERQVQSMLTPPPPAPSPARIAVLAPMPAPTPIEPETPAVAAVPEFIGLDQMFEVTDSELRAFSPKNTFTKLKKPVVVSVN